MVQRARRWLKAIIAVSILTVSACGSGNLPNAGATTAAGPSGASVYGGSANAAQAQTSGMGIHVQGMGSVLVKPDTAVVVLGAVVVKPTVDVAIAEVTQRMDAVDRYLKSAGIPEEDIQTEFFNVSQETAYPPKPGPEGTSEMVYRANHQQRVIVRDINKVGEIVAGAVKAGANSVQSVSYTVWDATPYLRQARERAMQDAKQKASQLADLAGVQLGPVTSLVEAPTPVPIPSGAGGERAYFQPGTASVSVSLDVVFSIR